MNIEMHVAERSGLSEFADKHGFVMEVHERRPRDMGSRWSEDSRYFAHFKDCEVKDGSVLCGTFGNGATPEIAMLNYTAEISEKLLVVGAHTSSRREIRAPVLTYNVEVRGR